MAAGGLDWADNDDIVLLALALASYLRRRAPAAERIFTVRVKGRVISSNTPPMNFRTSQPQFFGIRSIAFDLDYRRTPSNFRFVE